MFDLLFYHVMHNDIMSGETAWALLPRAPKTMLLTKVTVSKTTHGCATRCSCTAGYMGERCQLSDLEWWDLQQSEEEKRRNVVIAACMVALVSLLSVVACLTYCYG